MSIEKPVTQMVNLVYASDMPQNVLDWCDANEISTHYQADVAILDPHTGKDNPFITWLEDVCKLTKPPGNHCWYVAVLE